MKTDLIDYVKHYPAAVSRDICNLTVNALESAEWSRHTFYNPVNNSYYSNSSEPNKSYSNIETTKVIMDVVWKQVETYILKDFNFPWWNSWQGFNIIKFNRYTATNSMAEHCDHIHDMFDGERKGIPILTVIGLLNSEFKGGEFIILQDKVINLKAGDILIFPSVFMYPHKVNQITQGTRYSFASWVY